MKPPAFGVPEFVTAGESGIYLIILGNDVVEIMVVDEVLLILLFFYINIEKMAYMNDTTAVAESQMDYLILVDKTHRLPEDWEEHLDLVMTVNSVSDVIFVERTTYHAYLGLKEDLAKEGIDLDLDSAYRSVAYQQDVVMSRFHNLHGNVGSTNLCLCDAQFR